MTASLPPLSSVIATPAPTHHDHPAKAQAVAAELKVWKSWRGMRSQRGESNPEKQVGKAWKVDKQAAAQGLMATSGPTVRASQPCLTTTQAQVTNRTVLLLSVCMLFLFSISCQAVEKEVSTLHCKLVLHLDRFAATCYQNFLLLLLHRSEKEWRLNEST